MYLCRLSLYTSDILLELCTRYECISYEMNDYTLNLKFVAHYRDQRNKSNIEEWGHKVQQLAYVRNIPEINNMMLE